MFRYSWSKNGWNVKNCHKSALDIDFEGTSSFQLLLWIKLPAPFSTSTHFKWKRMFLFKGTVAGDFLVWRFFGNLAALSLCYYSPVGASNGVDWSWSTAESGSCSHLHRVSARVTTVKTAKGRWVDYRIKTPEALFLDVVMGAMTPKTGV